MKVIKQKIRFGNVIITTVDNGKDRIKTVRPFKVDIPNELVKNIITGMNHSQAVPSPQLHRLVSRFSGRTMYKKRG